MEALTSDDDANTATAVPADPALNALVAHMEESYRVVARHLAQITDLDLRYHLATAVADRIRSLAADASTIRAEAVLAIKDTDRQRLKDLAERLSTPQVTMKVSRTHQLIQQAKRRRAELAAATTTEEGP